jgi:hypothetical protein
MLFAVPFGIIAGLILGVAAGMLLGILNGLLLAALTYFFFLKTDNAAAYRRAARLGGAMVTVAVLVAAWAALGFESNAFVGGGPAGTIDGGSRTSSSWRSDPCSWPRGRRSLPACE